MTKKILLIGNGGREHALAKALARSPQKPEIYNFASAINPGIQKLCQDVFIGNIMDLEEAKKIAQQLKPDFTIIGPDDPIGIGMNNALAEIGIKSFAPTKANAQLESSKSFTRNLVEKYNIPGNPDYIVSSDVTSQDRRNFFNKHEGAIVVKADGLMGGKGVLVAGDHFTSFEEADEFSRKAIEKFGKVVLEEKFIGQEFSLISLVDGKTVLDTPAIQDHKRAFEGDTGPNTGGMGCYSDEKNSLPFITKKDLADAHEITEQTMRALEKENGEPYCGVMYGGFIATRNGVKLIEYNARFGDPEALNILPILETDFVDVCEKAIYQKLDEIGELAFAKKATVVKYLCPEGYPDAPIKNVPFTISKDFKETPDQQIFFASVSEENEQLLLKGSRAIGLLGIGDTLPEALEKCNALIDSFHGPLFSRKDIGTQALIQKRIDHMKKLRA